jgi:ubiquitin related modifier 1
MKVSVELGGGLELLFKGSKALEVNIDGAGKMGDLLQTLRHQYLSERPELFLSGHNIRPGILVLINKVDWELEGQLAYSLQDNDVVTFISTLHGG